MATTPQLRRLTPPSLATRKSKGGLTDPLRRLVATTPIRSCIGCRTRRPDNELVRVAVADGELVIDTRGYGRGAWLCRTEECVRAAGKQRAFSRALRSKLADAVLADTLLCWLSRTPH